LPRHLARTHRRIFEIILPVGTYVAAAAQAAELARSCPPAKNDLRRCAEDDGLTFFLARSIQRANKPLPNAKCAMPKISVIVPCFNEEDVLPKLFERLGAVAATWNADYEIICVDDGSRDRTWEILKTQNHKDSRWRYLAFARNFGHQVAVSAGLFYATGDAVVIIDADLQDPPEQIARLLEKWREGFQVVYAVRTKRDDAKLKQFLAWGFYRLLSLAVPFNVPADAGDFCLLDRRVVAVMNALPERNRYLRGLRAWSGFARRARRNTRSKNRSGWRWTECSRFPQCRCGSRPVWV
jgi:glycosyltransferase involved in cell wall biosynthesis